MSIKFNTNLNDKEFKERKIILQSFPKYITLGTHYGCNAKCVFCLGGNYPKFSLKIYKEFFEKKLYEVLRNAEHIGFCGYGEVLLMPDILDFLDYINKTLKDNKKVFTTNGIPINKEIIKRFGYGKYDILISLHASNKELHKYLTGTDSFELIVSNIKRLKKLKILQPENNINIIFLLTKMNIDCLPEFVKFSKDIGADRVTVNYITIFDEKHIEMSPYFLKSKTIEIFEKAEEVAKELEFDIILPPKFGNKDDTNDIHCRDPWEFFYVEVQGSVNPCCFAGNHIGYLNRTDFKTIWNSEGYVRLRKGLIENAPYTWCKYCYKYKPSNVNDIRSHITFRPETQRRILNYIKSNPEKFGVLKELEKYD